MSQMLTARHIAGRSKVDYDNVLADSEREAVADLLNYLENVLYTQRLEACLDLLQDVRRRLNLYAPADYSTLQRGETDFFSGEPLAALSTLVYSQNIDLQRSASLTFAEITERGMSETASTGKEHETDWVGYRCQTGGQSDPRAYPIPPRKPRHRGTARRLGCAG